ncbi:DUF4124 domain-containing protein [Caldimonas tepidiphila]|uniref:DUF4124 domain-containing protein n=1 Tax=Caldimonas tepidiphila TaxID=2315841 RepID=UPI000E5A8CBF|nr:DUF4124 domain-containing protein [Caldimonas tepidiphila]
MMQRPLRPLRIGLALLGLMTAMPGFALYKVVGPDGRVSYTDRPPQESAKVQPLSPAGGAAAPDAALPFELRQAVQRHPVTLYTRADCAPCDSGRALLRRRGVPHVEKSVATSADAEAFRRLGGQSLPLLQVGTKRLEGFTEDEWNSYLDAAAYPAQSRLPSSHAFGKATPLAAAGGTPAPATSAGPAPSPAPAAAPQQAPAGGGNAPPGFRF